MSEGKAALESLLASLGKKPTKADLAPLANSLSIIAGKSPPWTWRYLHSIFRGNLLAGPRILNAIQGYDKKSMSGWFDEKICPSCGRSFLPNVPWRKKCPVCNPPKGEYN